MQKQIKKQIADLKHMACSTPSDNSKEQIEALKAHFGVSTFKQLYHCLENELTNGVFAALKKVSIVLFLVFGAMVCKAQDKWYMPSKKDFISYGLMAASGVAKGYNQAVMHHYYKRGDQFWDKTISWQNKYKDYPTDQRAAFIGSKGIFVFLTDGQHLTSTLNTTFLIAGTGLLTWDMKERLKELSGIGKVLYVLVWKIIVPFGIRTATFELTFKKLQS